MAIQPGPLAFWSLFDDEEDEDEDPCGPVAVVRIMGPLVYHGSWYYDSYEDVESEFAKKLADPAVQAVVLRIDSPGGHAAGCFETVKRMRAAKAAAGKPVFAFVDERACSAAYALACVADEIWLPPAGEVGSVGVLLVLRDYSKANELEGKRVVPVVSGEQKADGLSDIPLSDEALARFQASVDHLAQLFFALVAEARGLTADGVKALEAATFLGATALDARLADRLGSLSDVMLAAAQRASARASISPSAGAISTTRPPMKELLALLGLPDGATEAEAIAALSSLRTMHNQLASLTGKANVEEILGAVRAYQDNAKRVGAVEAQLKAVQDAQAASERTTLSSKLRERGYSKAEVEALASSLSLEAMRAYVEVAQPRASAPSEPAGPAASVALTADDKVVAKQLGLSEQEFLNNKAKSQKGGE